MFNNDIHHIILKFSTIQGDHLFQLYYLDLIIFCWHVINLNCNLSFAYGFCRLLKLDIYLSIKFF